LGYAARMALRDITRAAVLAAIDEFDRLGREEFLRKYGFGQAKMYQLTLGDRRYDSKAILGVAHAFQLPEQGALKHTQFSGGEKAAAARLERLGFKVEKVGGRNPPWARDELILALDLYMRHRKVLDDSHPEVIELSEILNRLPLQLDRPDKVRFRNPNGVALKLSNFAHLDPQYPGKGMSGGGKVLEPKVWEEFSGDKERLRKVAQAIRAGVASGEVAAPQEDEEALDFPEGAATLRMHRGRERDPKVKRAAIKAALRRSPRLACVVCDMSFGEKYGVIGSGYIECHHTIPVSDLKPGARTRIQDVALVCSNCHRMVHRRRPWLALTDLKKLLG